MLTTLEKGIKGGKWFALIDKVWSLPNLRASFTKVRANRGAAGVDHQTIGMFAKQLDANLEALCGALREGTYRPQAIRRVYIPKPGTSEKRPLGIPTVRDRIVQTALRSVLEPIFEQDFAEHSYGFRPHRGGRDALRRVDTLLKTGYTHVVDADLKSYFDSIPHEKLMSAVQTKIADGRVRALLKSFLEQKVMEGMEAWTPPAGSPQGAVISPLLSNIYLTPLDRLMATTGVEMVRYADDFVVLCRSRQEAEAALAQVQNWTAAAGLTLHPEKTRIVDFAAPGGFDFLGYHFERDRRRPDKVRRWVRPKSLKRLRTTLREKTPRYSGKKMSTIIDSLNRTLRGWFAYFQHSDARWRFRSLDGWLRRRLRRMLLARNKKHRRSGRGGLAHRRWPNAFFAAQGLFSLETAHAQACQSAPR
jgi:RNA-directed DNA polymerase